MISFDALEALVNDCLDVIKVNFWNYSDETTIQSYKVQLETIKEGFAADKLALKNAELTEIAQTNVNRHMERVMQIKNVLMQLNQKRGFWVASGNSHFNI